MSNWGWHTAPTQDGKVYEWEDLQLTSYPHAGREVYYPVEAKPGNEEVYHWLRHNPHKFNLARISLCRANGEAIKPEDIKNAHQELDLYSGMLDSRFILDGKHVGVTTVCDPESDTIAFRIVSHHKGLGVKLEFPYGHHDTSGSDWESPGKHTTTWKLREDDSMVTARRQMDDMEYYVDFNIPAGCTVNADSHVCEIMSDGTAADIRCGFRFSPTMENPAPHTHKASKEEPTKSAGNSSAKASLYTASVSEASFADFYTASGNAYIAWAEYWNKVRLADFSQTSDPRAKELERRMVLSLYLLRIQSMGSLPSAETGLTVNSWYGRFHSEMYLWHSAFLPLWNLGERLLPSLKWYYSIIPQAKALAHSNGYSGLRWPKQPAITGRDAPSPIAPLLVWQQPHIIYMLELLYQNTYKNRGFLQQHWEMVHQLAEFMASFLHLDTTTGQYEMLGPLIPAQEEFGPMEAKSPIFEMEYFRFGLGIACKWGSRLGHDTQEWRNIADNIAPPVIKDGLYLAHALCPDTYTKYNKDHPMMTGVYGLFKSPKIQPDTMKATLKKVIECWQQETMWGWDYAMMAMCAIAIGNSELAVDLLLCDSPKNQYVTSGNNYQRTRTDLPLYLPGNGSLLLALAMLFDNPPKGWSIMPL